jgi:hypothetical protein
VDGPRGEISGSTFSINMRAPMTSEVRVGPTIWPEDIGARPRVAALLKGL